MSASVPIAAGRDCSRCAVALREIAYEVRTPEGARSVRCLRCSLIYGPLVRRSFVVALIVGTVLTAINQGNIILAGDFPVALYWKIPLTYAVPYCVATTGAILNSRSKAVSGQPSAIAGQP